VIRHVVLFRDVRNDWRRTAMDFPDLRQDACLEEMHVVTRGRVYTGFYAYRALAWSLPAVWPLVPMLYLPGVPFIGRHVYRWVAERRLAGTCPVPPAKLPSSPIPVVAQRSTGWDGSIAHDEATPAAPPSPPAR